MIKILNSMIFALLLTSCSAQDELKESDTNATTIVEKQDNNGSTKETNNSLKKSIFTLNMLNGQKIHVNEAPAGLTFQEYKNKSVFLVFFGYKCPPCLKEMPHLIELIKKKHPDLEIIAIELQGLNAEKLAKFQQYKEINYTLGTGSANEKFVSYIASKAHWGGSIPFMIAFNKEGEVNMVHVGSLNSQQLNEVYLSTKK